MSWLFSRALVEAFSEGICSDGEPSAPSSGSHTPQAYLPPDRMIAFSRPSRFGMTFSPLTADRGEELLTSYLAAFRARTSASQAREPASTEPAAACGDTWRGSLARFDPDTSSWRTVQPSLLEDLGESSVIWPRSGMTAAGQCWELPTLERRTKETGSGLWLPTPTVGMVTGGQNPETGGQVGLGYMARKNAWPTPVASDTSSRTKPYAQGGTPLSLAVKWPTPTARDWKSGKASDATMERNSRPLSEQIGGSLNPTWVEWLMGWPLGWTDLRPLETDKSPSALQQRGEF
jgi:hypothetical protein